MKRLAALAYLAAVSSTVLAQATFQGDVARTGVYAGKGPTQAPAVKWTFKAAGPIVTSPAIETLAWDFQTEGAKADPMKVLNADGGLNREAFKPVFGDFQDMYVDFYRFISVGAIMGSPTVTQGVVYFGSTDGNLYALM